MTDIVSSRLSALRAANPDDHDRSATGRIATPRRLRAWLVTRLRAGRAWTRLRARWRNAPPQRPAFPTRLRRIRGLFPLPRRRAPAPDLLGLAYFYGTPRGAEIARQLGATLRRLGGQQGRGSLIAGLGYPGPYLRAWPQARRIDASLMPIPTERVDPADLVIVVHALEFADDPRALLREAWKLLADHGRLLVVVPHRAGPLAYSHATPFGRGRTWGISELDRLLAANLFRTETRRLALSLPWPVPAGATRLRRVTRALSAVGDPLLGGVIVASAVKDVYAGLPLERPALVGSLRPTSRRVLQIA